MYTIHRHTRKHILNIANYHSRTKDCARYSYPYTRNEGKEMISEMVPLFRNHGTRGGQWLGSPIGRFTSEKRAPGTH